MKLKHRLFCFFGAVGMLVLIIDGRTAIAGAGQGIDLCIKVVVPSLFPFFLLSVGMTEALSGAGIPLLRPLGRLCGIPRGSETILLTGFLGGYPVGAQAVSAAYRKGSLNRTQASRMLSFCSNAGPSFLFGMIAFQFPGIRYCWLLWAVHIISAVFVAVVTPSCPAADTEITPGNPLSLTQIMKKAISIMANVCGWVISFRVLIAFLDKWFLWALPVQAGIILSGFLELSNGCTQLQEISNIGLRFILCAAMLGFGGICVTMQTASVVGNLPMASYLRGKLLQTVFSVILAVILQPLLPHDARIPGAIPLSAAFTGIVLTAVLLNVKKQNNSRNPAAVGV